MELSKRPEPLEVIGAIRDSFADSTFVYTNGSCFSLYRILKTIFPEAEAWTDMDHVWTKIGEDFYDIYGVREGAGKGLVRVSESPGGEVAAHSWSWRSRWRILPGGRK